MFPCKPTKEVRQVQVEGKTMEARLHACKVNQRSFALSHVDVGDPAQVGAALRVMRESWVAKVSASAASAVPYAVSGMTPQPEAKRQSFSGRLPDGSAVNGAVAVFAHGTVVYQALVLGDGADEAAIEGFLSSLKVPA